MNVKNNFSAIGYAKEMYPDAIPLLDELNQYIEKMASKKGVFESFVIPDFRAFKKGSIRTIYGKIFSNKIPVERQKNLCEAVSMVFDAGKEYLGWKVPWRVIIPSGRLDDNIFRGITSQDLEDAGELVQQCVSPVFTASIQTGQDAGRLLGQILLAAVMLGNLCSNQQLAALAEFLRTSSEFRFSRRLILVVNEPKTRNAYAVSWMPDLVTGRLIEAWFSLPAGIRSSALGSGKIDGKKIVVGYLRGCEKISGLAGVAEKKLFPLAAAWAVTEDTPTFLATISKQQLVTTPLLMSSAERLGQYAYEIGRWNKTISGVGKWIPKDTKELEITRPKYQLHPLIVRLIGALKESGASRIRANIDAISATYTEQSAHHVICEYAAWRALKGYPHKAPHKRVAARGIRLIGSDILAALQGFSDITAVSEDDWGTVFQEVFESASSESQLERILQECDLFRKFLKSQKNIISSDQDDQSSGSLRFGVSARVLTPDEYQRVMNRLKVGRLAQENPELSMIAQVTLISAYRGGLRRGEIMFLRFSDVHFEKELYFNVSPYEAHSLKSNASKRRVPIGSLVSPEEETQLRQFIASKGPDPLLKHRRHQGSFLYQKYWKDRFKVENRVISEIVALLREITGDPHITLHHTRHSMATFTLQRLMDVRPESLAAFIPVNDALRVALSGGKELREKFWNEDKYGSSLWAIAAILGHSTPVVSLRHYIHCVDWLLAIEAERRIRDQFYASTLQKFVNINGQILDHKALERRFLENRNNRESECSLPETNAVQAFPGIQVLSSDVLRMLLSVSEEQAKHTAEAYRIDLDLCDEIREASRSIVSSQSKSFKKYIYKKQNENIPSLCPALPSSVRDRNVMENVYKQVLDNASNMQGVHFLEFTDAVISAYEVDNRQYRLDLLTDSSSLRTLIDLVTPNKGKLIIWGGSKTQLAGIPRSASIKVNNLPRGSKRKPYIEVLWPNGDSASIKRYSGSVGFLVGVVMAKIALSAQLAKS